MPICLAYSAGFEAAQAESDRPAFHKCVNNSQQKLATCSIDGIDNIPSSLPITLVYWGSGACQIDQNHWDEMATSSLCLQVRVAAGPNEGNLCKLQSNFLTITMTKSSQHQALVKYLTKPRASHLTHISRKKMTVKIRSVKLESYFKSSVQYVLYYKHRYLRGSVSLSSQFPFLYVSTYTNGNLDAHETKPRKYRCL